MSEHCPGCRNSDPTPQKVDPLGVMKPEEFPDEWVWVDGKTAVNLALYRRAAAEAARGYGGREITRITIDEAKEIPEEEFMNASHGTMSKTMEHIGLRQLQAMMRYQEFLKSKEKK